MSEQRNSWPHYKVNGLNLFDTDRNLTRFLRRSAPGMLQRRRGVLSSFGAWCGGPLDAKAATFHDAHTVETHANPCYPDLERKISIRLDPDYIEAQRELTRRGFLAACLKDKDPESNLLPLTVQYLLGQVDIGVGCPWAMTHPEALLIKDMAPSAIRDRFLGEMRRTDGLAPVCGTWATERHSGSDIPGTVTTMIQAGDGTVLLNGHNFFSSAAGFDRYLAMKLARPQNSPPGGKTLTLTLVASHLDDDWSIPNDGVRIVRLKKKVGTRDLATAEIELKGAVAYELSPSGQGLKMLLEGVIAGSRVHNAMAAAGVMRRALLESLCWTAHRKTFGEPLIERPMIQKRILDIQTKWLAGSALAFEAARLFEEARHDDKKKTWSRMVTALAKFRTAEQAAWCTQKAMELVGGNGYTEEYPVARLYRDAQVLTLWEGPEQIQALEVMNIMRQGGGQAFIERLSGIAASLPSTFRAHSDRLGELLVGLKTSLRDLADTPGIVQQTADDYMYHMSNMLAYALLCEEGAWELAEYNDIEKMLFAKRFYDKSFVSKMHISHDVPALQRDFAKVIGGHGITGKQPVATNSASQYGPSGKAAGPG